MYNGSSFSTLDDPAGVGGTAIHGITGSTIVGHYLDSSQKQNGFVYNGSSFETLDDPAGVGGTYVEGTNGSTIVGSYVDVFQDFEGFIFNGSSFITLNAPAGVLDTFASGVNSSGTVVGSYEDSSEHFHGFVYSPPVVKFGSIAGTVLNALPTEIVASSPAGVAGTIDVTVTTTAGTSAVSSADRFQYMATPAVTSIRPVSGPAAGGTAVTITGSGFAGATQVVFGTTRAAYIQVNSNTQITAISPPGAVGTVDIRVVTPGGTSAVSSADQFTYPAAPALAGVSPAAGPLAGGTTVTITGTGLTGATRVDFGTTPATHIIIDSATQITATSPAGSGAVDVTVVTPRGTSAVSPADRFLYMAAPAVTGVSPAVGRSAGGESVIITGAGFTSATAVHFGAVSAASFVIDSATEITATSPAGAGTVNVTIVTPGGTSGTSSKDQFTYIPRPSFELTASDGAGGDRLGYAVAISGGTMVVGAPDAGSNRGAAYVYKLSGTNWVQVAKLVASDGAAGDIFGVSVAISGPTIVVGAEDATVGAASDRGAAYVFTGSGSSWSQAAKLTASDDAAGDLFGDAVAIAGGTIVVGSHQAIISPNIYHQGAAYVFTGSGTSWPQAAKLTVTGEPNATFGYSVAISGGTIVVGATVDGLDQGRAYVFTGSGSSWSLSGQLTASDGVWTDFFGASVAIAGGTIVVGAYGATIGGNNYQGAAYVFTQSGSNWSQATKLVAAAGAAYDEFGTSVAIGGGTIVVGAPYAAVGVNSDQGAAYEFTPSGASWAQSARITATDGEAYDNFGRSTSISGGTIVFSADNATFGGRSDQGAAYVGPWPVASVSRVNPAAGPTAGGTSVTITGTNFGGSTEVDFGATRANSFVVNSSTQITATSPRGSGTVDITVVTPGGTSGTSPADQFTYIPPPSVAGLSASAGPPAGGTTVEIIGSSLSGATAVLFGTKAGTIVSDTAAQIVVVSPAELTGVVDVTVTTASGISARSAADKFSFTPLALTSAANVIFTLGKAGSFSMKTGSANPTFSESGALPRGLSFTAAGVLSGTPARGTVGIYPIVITASDGVSPPATQNFTLMVATPEGSVYWLGGPAGGGWLEMHVAGSDVTQVIDTNVAEFAIDGSGSAVALESSGNLVMFAPNSSVRQPMATGVSTFVVDGSNSVVALQPKSGSAAGPIVRFAPGQTKATTIPGPFLHIAQDGADDVIALDDSHPTNHLDGLWLFKPGATSGVQMAAGVSAFVVDGSGSVVAFEPISGSIAGTLVRFAAGATTGTVIQGSYLSIAVDGKGDVVALDNSDPTNHLDALYLLTPGSTSPDQIASGVLTFLVDAGGSVVAFEATKGASTGTLFRFAPGATTSQLIASSVQRFELDGSGEVVALDSGGNLFRFAPGGVAKQPMDSGVTNFAVDAAGFVVAEVVFNIFAGDTENDLVQFSPGSTQGKDFAKGISNFAIDAQGAVVALFQTMAPNLFRFAPGSTQGRPLDPNYVQQFAVDGAGQVVAVESDGTLVRFVPGTAADSFIRTVMHDSDDGTDGIVYLHIDRNGYVIAAAGPYGTYHLFYFTPGSTVEHDYTFNFVASWFGDPAAPNSLYFSNHLVMADGTILVLIEADSIGIFHGDDYELFVVPTGQYPSNINPSDLYLTGVTPNDDNTSATPDPNQNIYNDMKVFNEVLQGIQVLKIILEEELIITIGIVVSYLSAGILAPAVAAVAVDVGVGVGVAEVIGVGVAAVVASAATQEIDIAVTGQGSFSWSKLVTAGLSAEVGGDLVGDLGDLSSVVDAGDDTLVGDALDSFVVEAAGSFAENLAEGGSLNSALGQAVNAGLGSLIDDIGGDLTDSLMSSTFVTDTVSFLNDVSDSVADLPFVQSALSFLDTAAGGNWSAPSFASFADSAASFLEQVASDNLGDTPFGGYVTSLLDQAVSGKLTGSSFAQGALSYLENTVADQLTSSDFAQNLGGFLNGLDQAEQSNPGILSNFVGFASTALGGGLGTFLQQAVSGNLNESTLRRGSGRSSSRPWARTWISPTRPSIPRRWPRVWATSSSKPSAQT